MFVEGAYKKIASFFNLKRKTSTTYFSKEKSIFFGGGSIKGLGPLHHLYRKIGATLIRANTR